MRQFARSYSRQISAPVASPEALSSGSPKRVRVVRGVLSGLTGQVISTADPKRWLIEADQPGLLVRISPAQLEPLS